MHTLSGGDGGADTTLTTSIAGTGLRRLAYERREPDFSLGRPSRRFPAPAGIVPARISARSKPRVMAVLDTSGSMLNDALLEIVRAELQGLAAVAEVLVVECDVFVRREYHYSGDIAGVVGGGGTSFCEPLSDAFLAPRHVDAVIYFTDGHGAVPDRSPLVNAVWCLLGQRGNKPVPWGDVVRMGYPEPSAGEADVDQARVLAHGFRRLRAPGAAPPAARAPAP